MNFLSLADPAFETQARAVMDFVGDKAFLPLYQVGLQHTLLLLPVVVLLILCLPFFFFWFAWMIHPIFGFVALLCMIGSYANFAEKERRKRDGTWTAQDETNERLNEMDWNNIIMQKQIIAELKEIAAATKRK